MDPDAADRVVNLVTGFGGVAVGGVITGLLTRWQMRKQREDAKVAREEERTDAAAAREEERVEAARVRQEERDEAARLREEERVSELKIDVRRRLEAIYREASHSTHDTLVARWAQLLLDSYEVSERCKPLYPGLSRALVDWQQMAAQARHLPPWPRQEREIFKSLGLIVRMWISEPEKSEALADQWTFDPATGKADRGGMFAAVERVDREMREEHEERERIAKGGPGLPPGNPPS